MPELKDLIETNIKQKLQAEPPRGFGTGGYSLDSPENPTEAQNLFIKLFSEAIADAVKQYLNDPQKVYTNPAGKGGVTTGPGFGPVGHNHPQLPHGITAL